MLFVKHLNTRFFRSIWRLLCISDKVFIYMYLTNILQYNVFRRSWWFPNCILNFTAFPGSFRSTLIKLLVFSADTILTNPRRIKLSLGLVIFVDWCFRGEQTELRLLGDRKIMRIVIPFATLGRENIFNATVEIRLIRFINASHNLINLFQTPLKVSLSYESSSFMDT